MAEVPIVILLLVIFGLPLLVAFLGTCKLLGCSPNIASFGSMVVVLACQGKVLGAWRAKKSATGLVAAAFLVVDVLLILGRMWGVIPPLR